MAGCGSIFLRLSAGVAVYGALVRGSDRLTETRARAWTYRRGGAGKAALEDLLLERDHFDGCVSGNAANACEFLGFGRLGFENEMSCSASCELFGCAEGKLSRRAGDGGGGGG
ncbi:hypothetical protein BDY21DRAFT_339750 [Lineolata rhizophorae]|uniref:Uncharacterized protein n=1 Tax=Lineolata rhizophorae TaxID=578093 RepID=A0A6A6P5C8_9PEZI|nr:hypothetical protein BDY21DRAFT_339750 [Lineolata rhizophorae]